MEKLEEFKFANLTLDNVEKINDLTVEELQHLKSEKGVLLVENRTTKQRGSSSYANLLVLESLGALKKYKVVGFKQPNLVVQLPKTRYEKFEKSNEKPQIQEPEPIEFIKPEVSLFNEETEVAEVVKRPRGRKPKN
jgi:hypothetical protein